MAIPRFLSNAVGVAAQQVGGAYDYLTPGSGSNTITNAGNAIVDPNLVYSGAINPFGGSGGRSNIHNGGTSGFTSVSSPTTSTNTGTNQYNETTPTDQNQNSGNYTGGNANTPDYASVTQANGLISQANNLLGRLGSQRDIGQNNISDTFGNYRNNLMNDYGRNESDFNQNRTSTIQGNEVAKNNIDRRVANRANSLQRQIGASGGGNSEAGLILAPYAAARTGTQLRNEVNNQYASNMSNLDQSFGRYKEDYGNSLNQLGDQEKQSRSSFLQSILQQEAQARDQLAQGQSSLNYANTGDSAGSQAIYNNAQPGLMALLQQIDQLGRQQITPNVRDATYSAPTLQNYTIGNTQNVQGVDPVLQDSVSPMYQYLLKKDENNLGY